MTSLEDGRGLRNNLTVPSWTLIRLSDLEYVYTYPCLKGYTKDMAVSFIWLMIY